VDEVRYVRAIFLWSRVPHGAYTAFPDAEFSVFFFLDRAEHPDQSALALAYVLWHISDACNYSHESNPVLIACSYIFLPDGVYGFCLYDKGLSPQFEKFSREAKTSLNSPFWFPVISTWCPAHLSEITDETIIRRCISNAAYVYLAYAPV
jgi:hypothetical protein